MRRGDVYWGDFEPFRRSEANTRRPAVIVSREGANNAVQETGRGTVRVVPLMTIVTFVAPFHVLIPAEESGLNRDSKA